MMNSSSDRNELCQVSAPGHVFDLQSYTNNTISTQRVSLFLHSRHGQLASMIQSLRQYGHLFVFSPARLLKADMINRAADHESRRIKSCFLDQQKFVNRQIAGEHLAVPTFAAHLFEALSSVFGKVALHVIVV